jgi:tetratricopeptide (TPR) repeat protein
MNEHPTQEDLLVLAQGRLPKVREREVILHLLQPCEACLGLLARPLSEWPSLSQEEAEALDGAISRAFDVALLHHEHARAQQSEAEGALRLLREGGFEATASLPLRMGTLAKIQVLLARSWELRVEDTGLMVQFAYLAWQCARRLDTAFYGVQVVSDLQCRSLIELANAYRLSDQFRLAWETAYEARILFEKGMRDEHLEARLLTVEATIYADGRQFQEATANLLKVYRLHTKHGDRHLAGRTLMKLGLYYTYAGDASEALKFLKQSLTLIDRERDPLVAYFAMRNLVAAYCDAGQFDEAEKALFRARALQPPVTGQLNHLRARWQEGCVDAGLNRLDRAVKTFEETRAGFLNANRAFDAALVSLDLAATLLAQGLPADAESVVGEAIQIFVALRVEREALAALITLRTVCEARAATRAMVLDVASFIRRFVPDPGTRPTPGDKSPG